MTRIQRAHLRIARALAKVFDAKRDLLAARQSLAQLKRKKRHG